MPDYYPVNTPTYTYRVGGTYGPYTYVRTDNSAWCELRSEQIPNIDLSDFDGVSFTFDGLTFKSVGRYEKNAISDKEMKRCIDEFNKLLDGEEG